MRGVKTDRITPINYPYFRANQKKIER